MKRKLEDLLREIWAEMSLDWRYTAIVAAFLAVAVAFLAVLLNSPAR